MKIKLALFTLILVSQFCYASVPVISMEDYADKLMDICDKTNPTTQIQIQFVDNGNNPFWKKTYNVGNAPQGKPCDLNTLSQVLSGMQCSYQIQYVGYNNTSDNRWGIGIKSTTFVQNGYSIQFLSAQYSDCHGNSAPH